LDLNNCPILFSTELCTWFLFFSENVSSPEFLNQCHWGEFVGWSLWKKLNFATFIHVMSIVDFYNLRTEIKNASNKIFENSFWSFDLNVFFQNQFLSFFKLNEMSFHLILLKGAKMRFIFIFKQRFDISLKWWNEANVLVEQRFCLVWRRLFLIIQSDNIGTLINT
jgi:hypothetical protein